MKNRKCPIRELCFGYSDGDCDGCVVGQKINKLQKRIDRLKKQNEALTIQRNAWFLSAKAVKPIACRDCKHNQDNGGDCNRTITHTSRDYVCEVNEYRYIGLEYCSYGERREKNEG